MRTFLIGVLLAATATAPALADKGGHGKGGGPKGGGGPAAHAPGPGGGPKGGGWKHGGGPQAGFAAPRGGGWQHQDAFAGKAQRGSWDRKREPRFDRAPAFAELDEKRARKALREQAKAERRFDRAYARQTWLPPGQRWAARPAAARYRTASWYHAPAYLAPFAAVPAYYAVQSWSPVQNWSSTSSWNIGGHGPYGGGRGYGYDDGYYDNGRAHYAYDDGAYAPIGDPFGSGDMLTALLPVLLQSILGGGTALSGIGSLGSDINVLPLQQASYAPALGGGGDLPSLLLPAVLGDSFN